MDLNAVLSLYARGLFPMDGPEHDHLPWWVADPRAVFELDEPGLARVRHATRRSLPKAGADWVVRLDLAFEEVLADCARPREDGDGVWITDRMVALYRTLHAAGHCHTFELWCGDELGAGILGVTLGRAVMLESMTHRVGHAGNVLVWRTLKMLAEGGCALCDIQIASDHTRRLGAVEIERAEYERRLALALAD